MNYVSTFLSSTFALAIMQTPQAQILKSSVNTAIGSRWIRRKSLKNKIFLNFEKFQFSRKNAYLKKMIFVPIKIFLELF